MNANVAYIFIINGYYCYSTDTSKMKISLCLHYISYTGVVIIIPPTITNPPSDTLAYLYSQVELTCVATGNPQPIIHWFKDGKRLFTSDADPPILLIEEMGLDDRGFYHCEATNSAGKDVSMVIVLNINCTLVLTGLYKYECLLLINSFTRYCAIQCNRTINGQLL